jgi:hypothetical protein
MWQQWINFILGLWLVISAYTGMALFGVTLNLTIVGLVVAALSLWGALSYPTREQRVGEHERGQHYKTT